MGISPVVYAPGRILKLFVWGREIGLFSALTDNTAFCGTVNGGRASHRLGRGQAWRHRDDH